MSYPYRGVEAPDDFSDWSKDRKLQFVSDVNAIVDGDRRLPRWHERAPYKVVEVAHIQGAVVIAGFLNLDDAEYFVEKYSYRRPEYRYSIIEWQG